MKTKALLITVSTIFCITHLVAQESSSKVKSLSVFKNGQSFVTKELKVPVNDNVYKIDKLPNALFGTLWFYGISQPITAVSAKVENFTDKRERKANTFLELLYANKGKNITVNTSENHTYQGIIEDFDLPEEIKSQQQLQQVELKDSYQGLYNFENVFAESSPAVLLKMSGKWISIDPATIRNIEFADKPNRAISPSIAIRKPVVTLNFPKNGMQSLEMMYLQNGIFWTPTYKMQLLSDTKAQLEMQIEVSNEVETITNTDVDFVVGVPNFAPATSLATLINFPVIQSILPHNSNAISQIVADNYEQADAREVAEMPRDVPNNISSEKEDLYFYTIKNVNLAKGGRAQFPVFSSPINIRHFYKSTLPLSNMANYRLSKDAKEEEFTYDEGKVNPSQTGEVSHFIEIDNGTPAPFTSGSLLVLHKESQKALAQSTLNFTPKGSKTDLFITTSPDIEMKDAEKVVEIKKNKTTFSNDTYRQAIVKGKISINNSKSKSINMEIQKNILGKAIEASVKYDQYSQLNTYTVNPHSQLNFKIEVKAGERKDITYTYLIYIKEG